MNRDPLLVIDCDTCVMRDTEACHDCVMSYLCRDDPHEAVVFDLAEIRAMRVLAEACVGSHWRVPNSAESSDSMASILSEVLRAS